MYTLLILSLKSKKIDLCLLSIEKVLTQHSVQVHQATPSHRFHSDTNYRVLIYNFR